MTIITPPHAGSLMAYVGADSPIGYGPFGPVWWVDHTNTWHVQECLGNPGDNGFKKFDGDVPADELAQVSDTDLLTDPALFGSGTGCIHPDGNLYVSVGTTAIASQTAPIAKVRLSDMTLVQMLGGFSTAGGASTCATDGTLLQLRIPFGISPLQRGNSNLVITHNIRGAGFLNEVAVVNVDDDLLLYAYQIAESVAQLCPGRSNSDVPVASFYCTGVLFNYGVGNSTPFALYEFKVYNNNLTDYGTIYLPTNGAVSSRKIRSVAPTDIDATWSTFAAVSPPGYDSADGNILVMAATEDAVTNTMYLTKFNAQTGAIMWQYALNSAAFPVDLANSTFNGTFEFFDGPNHQVVRINLVDGTLTSNTAWNDGLSLSHGQIYDYLTASIFGQGAYTESTGPIPTYLGSYLAGSGDTIPAARVDRIYTGAPYDDGQGGGVVINDTARSQAWTFTRDGHTFYVLNLGTAEGTFIYDVTTEQWCEFDTAGYGQWNMRNGCMWGDRIVGGSSTGVQIWELDPEAVTDEGALNMNHAVTGAIPRRSRDAIGCYAIRVTASFGQLDDQSGATFNLRYSDDQGQTWSPYQSLTLTEGDFDSELAWRALGSFAAPGRVFEFSDSGALIRIDGADMNPEDDDDGAA